MNRGTFFLGLILFSLAVSAQEKNGFSHVISSLEKYQGVDGGFRMSEGESSSTEATSYGLFLASLYGLKDKLNVDGLKRFLRSVENGDNGFANRPGLSSDLESVSHALSVYQALGGAVPNTANTANFVKSLYNTESKLFSKRVGDKGDVKSTALAFQALELLNAQKTFLKEITPSVLDYLQKNVQKTAKHTSFSFNVPAADKLSANYYGILLGSLVGFQFADASKWAAFLLENPSTSLSSANAFYTLASLKLLSSKDSNFVEQFDVQSFLNNAKKTVSNNLLEASFAHKTVALSKLVSDQFDKTFLYEVDQGALVSNRFIQGTKFRPSLKVTGVDNRLIHSGLMVELVITLPDGTSKKEQLSFLPETQSYSSPNSVDTSNQLGAISFQYNLQWNVPGLGDLKFTVTDNKDIGYAINVASEAKFGGKDIQEGETIGIGTEFRFGVTLSNQSSSQFVSGDFQVLFSVLDSASNVLTSSSVDGKTNKDKIRFEYTLKSAAVPAGRFTVRFQVKNAQGVHTTKDIVYNLAIPMIATHITFENAPKDNVYKIGEKVTVSMVPASLPDLRTVNAYTAESGQKLALFMDITSPTGLVKQSLPGTLVKSDKNAKFVFESIVRSTLEILGKNIISFRYVPTASKESVHLSNYDSAHDELYDESATLSFTVSSELHLVEVDQKPKDSDFYYGNEIVYKFKVKDNVSGKYVVAEQPDITNVYLSLKNKAGKRTVTSVRQPATQFTDTQGVAKGFLLKWLINPNAFRGAGALSITVEDVDGTSTPLSQEKSKDAVSYNVNIGGDISVKSNYYASTSTSDVETAFVVQFSLYCQDRKLKDAHLRCTVNVKDESGVSSEFTVPVVSGEDGSYQVSWNAAHDKAASGDYVLNFYREVDRPLDGESVSPLVTITVPHQTVAESKLPFKTEFLVTVVLGSLFFYVFQKKQKYGKL